MSNGEKALSHVKFTLTRKNTKFDLFVKVLNVEIFNTKTIKGESWERGKNVEADRRKKMGGEIDEESFLKFFHCPFRLIEKRCLFKIELAGQDGRDTREIPEKVAILSFVLLSNPRERESGEYRF